MPIEFRRTVPIFRIFDVSKAREFYLDFLGFTVDWEHRFDERAPLYLQVSRGDLALHLSEHHGDSSPGSTTYVRMTGVQELQAELEGRDYPYLRPGLSEDELGLWLEVVDPFGNRLRFNEPAS